MSQSTQLPWRRRGSLDLLFHCEGRPRVILGSPMEQCIHCARCYASGSICTVADGGYHFCILAWCHCLHSFGGCLDDNLLLKWNRYVMELLPLWVDLHAFAVHD